MKNKTECPECLGNGYFLYPNEEECAACNGTGRKQMENKPNSTEIINNWAQWKKDIVGDKSALKCPLCGGEVFDYNQAYVFRGGKDVYLTLWECKLCKAVFQLEGLPAEARERFMKRPESAWEMYQRLHNKYYDGWAFVKACRDKLHNWREHLLTALLALPEQEAIAIMQQIEKELKG